MIEVIVRLNSIVGGVESEVETRAVDPRDAARASDRIIRAVADQTLEKAITGMRRDSRVDE